MLVLRSEKAVSSLRKVTLSQIELPPAAPPGGQTMATQVAERLRALYSEADVVYMKICEVF